MDTYYVNKKAQSNGDHEVHKSFCIYMPFPENRFFLGDFPSCHDAVRKARLVYPKADGCKSCLATRHISF